MWGIAAVTAFTTSTGLLANPLLILGGLLALVGLQMLCLGILSELAVRIYFDRERRLPYAIGRRYGFDNGVRVKAA